MNNIFLNNDPLLYRNQAPPIPFGDLNNPNNINDYYSNMYRQQLMDLQLQQMPFSDCIGELDKEVKELDLDVLTELNNNQEYVQLSNELLGEILREIISLVRNRLNLNPLVIKNVEKQKELIKKCQLSIKTQEKQSMSELNDYMKNYSHLTFDEYKKIKSEKK